MYITWHDANFYLIRSNHTGTVGTDQNGIAATQLVAGFNHIPDRNSLGNTDHQVHFGVNRFVNRSGGPALATGGTGDVLSGVIAGLVAGSGLEAFEAACLGVYVHGAAADDVAGDCDRGLLASELASGIPDVLLRMRDTEAGA